MKTNPPLVARLTTDTRFKASFNDSISTRFIDVDLKVKTGGNHDGPEHLGLNLTHSRALLHIPLSDRVPERQRRQNPTCITHLLATKGQTHLIC